MRLRRSLIGALIGLTAISAGLLAPTATLAVASSPTAVSTTTACTDGRWPLAVQGVPTLWHAGAGAGDYLWHDETGWHLRVTHASTIGFVFSGTIRANRPLHVRGYRLESGDHFTVSAESDACEIGELIEFLDKHDVDGFIATSRGRALAAGNASLAGTVEDVRAMIRCRRWENFSRILDASYAATAGMPAPQKISATGEGAYEEGD